MPTRGYDSFFTKPFEKPGMICRVCGARCKSARHQRGPTSFGEAMNRVSRIHDVYVCPRTHQPWHEQALRLRMAIEESPSPSLRSIMQKDLDLLLSQHPLPEE